MNDTKNLSHYVAAWELSNPRFLTQTRTGSLYTVSYGGETVILKLLARLETEEQRAALALRYFDGDGAVRLLRNDDAAQLMEYAAGDPLASLVERGDDESATRIIAEVIARLHGSRPVAPPAGLMPLERWFEALFVQAAADRSAGHNSIFVRGAAVAERLLADPRDIRVLHGDIQHYNIRQSPRGWLAFDPKGLVGERTYDCANALCNPGLPEVVHNETRLLSQAAILADLLALDLGRVLAFTYAWCCLNASWWLGLGGSDLVRWYLKVAAISEPHLAPLLA